MAEEKLCELCKREKARFKVRDKLNKKELYICAWCESGEFELVEDLGIQEQKQKAFNEDGWGRLHIVKKTKKLATCRICNKDIEIGSSCYNQAQHISNLNGMIHVNKKVCKSCADNLIKEGTEVV